MEVKKFLVKVFLMLALLMEYIFLTTFYGLQMFNIFTIIIPF